MGAVTDGVAGTADTAGAVVEDNDCDWTGALALEALSVACGTGAARAVVVSISGRKARSGRATIIRMIWPESRLPAILEP
ncbi:hypothetical protein Tasa_040_010 [Tanticharoenia sakaeratensis NBRC 103193]|uniref:Uncharacterized protein n=1 Tax=Tanticharoenia sakaeratensis NBRC 103193 TaxID=1231623 RepID=A0A0D6MPG4_9PROT|nr:hypothetical protein Tasa_040_010 [Tanticharoenia sakaeratensis NBRC 103193]GBQ22654.1 hypothetical protein AA103193_2142 [Tanticharoenia sakaeratensis NBRC 103193]